LYNLLSIDLDWIQSSHHVKELNKLFFNKIKYAKKIIFANHHHSILFGLENIEKINLYNIDHHHDICYSSWQKNDIENKIASHGCWVGNLLEEGKIIKYHWFKNFNSDPIKDTDDSEKLILKNKIEFLQDEYLEGLQNINFEHIFVCKSVEYISNDFKQIFEVYKDVCNYFFPEKFYENKFNIDVPNAGIFFNK
jgi:CRISPR/Cas system-associated endoribonuclease Cas2